MWIKKIETGWILGEYVKDKKITVHITRDPDKDVLLHVNGKYVGLLKGSFFFSKWRFDRVIYTSKGDIELHLKTAFL